MDRQTKEMFLVANGWVKINDKWFYSSIANLDVDTAYNIQLNNVIDSEEENQYSNSGRVV